MAEKVGGNNNYTVRVKHPMITLLFVVDGSFIASEKIYTVSTECSLYAYSIFHPKPKRLPRHSILKPSRRIRIIAIRNQRDFAVLFDD